MLRIRSASQCLRAGVGSARRIIRQVGTGLARFRVVRRVATYSTLRWTGVLLLAFQPSAGGFVVASSPIHWAMSLSSQFQLSRAGSRCCVIPPYSAGLVLPSLLPVPSDGVGIVVEGPSSAGLALSLSASVPSGGACRR